MAGPIVRLADQGDLDFLRGFAHRMGHPRHLLFEPPWANARLALAVCFAAIAVWAIWLSRRRQAITVFVLLLIGLVSWWITILPSHHREWRPEVAVMPRATIDGDRVRITGVRDFDYRSRNDFTVHYEEREVQLSHLTGLDFFVSYWSEGPVGHTFVSWIFLRFFWWFDSI